MRGGGGGDMIFANLKKDRRIMRNVNLFNGDNND